MTAQGFRSIVGHREVIRHFQAAIAGGRIHHAYLITGEAGSGKRMMAEALAQTLQCEKVAERLKRRDELAEAGTEAGAAAFSAEDADACLTCLSCRKAMDHNHPDIIYVTHEKPNVISVGEVRAQLVNTVDILPYESRYKIYIVPEAEKLNVQAQNAILKTIEEPPEYAVILLLTESPEALLPTIHSRCVTVPLLPVPDADVREYLSRELHMPDYEVKMLTAYARGNIGRAETAATDEDFIGRRDRTVQLIKSVQGMDTATILEVIRYIKEDKAVIGDVFDIMRMWFRDVLLFKATADVDQLIFSNEISAIRAQASGSSYEGLQEILDAINRCQTRLGANVNFELALELMLFTIKENCHA